MYEKSRVTKESEGLTKEIRTEQKEILEKFYEQRMKDTKEIDEIEENRDRIEKGKKRKV